MRVPAGEEAPVGVRQEEHPIVVELVRPGVRLEARDRAHQADVVERIAKLSPLPTEVHSQEQRQRRGAHEARAPRSVQPPKGLGREQCADQQRGLLRRVREEEEHARGERHADEVDRADVAPAGHAIQPECREAVCRQRNVDGKERARHDVERKNGEERHREQGPLALPLLTSESIGEWQVLIEHSVTNPTQLHSVMPNMWKNPRIGIQN